MKGISSMATRAVLGELADAAAAAGLARVEFESVGGVDAAKRVAAGEPFDLVVLASDALARLAADGHVLGDTVTPLVLSQVAVAVPEGAPGEAPTDADGVRGLLEAATAVGYSTGPSGTALVALVEEWGLADSVGPKLVQARPGVPVARSLAEGEVDLGFQQLSELVGQPVRILGVLPADCAIDTTFAGAVATASDDPEGAAAALAWLASPDAAPVKTRHAFGVPE